MRPESLEISNICRQDEHPVATSFVVSNGDHYSVDGRRRPPAGRYDLGA
ncbi:MAG: hypothetical protein ACYCS2_01430 [Acidimicrobiales bacterium]